jgi:hypothetical protein
MRLVFGVLSLLFVAGAVGLLAKMQLGPFSATAMTPAASAVVSSPASTVQLQSQQLQNQVKKSVEDAMRQARPESDDR